MRVCVSESVRVCVCVRESECVCVFMEAIRISMMVSMFFFLDSR